MLQGTDSRFKHAAQNLALIALSFALLPLDTLFLFWSWVLTYRTRSAFHRKRAAIRNHVNFQPKTILVTGVGMTKGLAIARNFYEAGHNVIGADFEADGTLTCGRVSVSLQEYVPLSKPTTKSSLSRYIQGILDIITTRNVDLWVSCSGVASAVEDGQVKEIVEARTSCKAIQFDVKMTQTLHEKDTFIAYTEKIGLTIPETHSVTSQTVVEEALRNAPTGRQYIMKPVGMDDSSRGDMTLFPRPTQEATVRHLSRLNISTKSPWILQQYIKGREYCTHSIVIKGQVKAFLACPSAELLMHYEAIQPNSKLSREMLKFTERYAEAGGETFTGHLSFDFFVENQQLDKLQNDANTKITLYPIECNPRAHTAVAILNGTTRMADAYLSLLEDDPPSSTGTIGDEIVIPRRTSIRYYWVGHDFVNLIVLPILSLMLLRPTGSVSRLVKGIDTFLDRLLFWKDGTYEFWDPLPWWWLYHVYWPWQFALSIWKGKKWSRINVSTCKMFEC